jgi:hypothetical protein
VVDVELSLTRVNQVRGTANQDASTPTSSGSGPLKLSNASSNVTMSEDITITRTVGRPGGAIRSSTSQNPNYIDHRKTAFDSFDIEFQLFKSGPSKVATLAKDIIQPTLGTTPLTLDFQGLFNMGSFSVIPNGSGALRYQRRAGQKSIENVPTLTLRRVFDLQ